MFRDSSRVNILKEALKYSYFWSSSDFDHNTSNTITNASSFRIKCGQGTVRVEQA